METNTRFKNIDNFCNKHLKDKRFIRHSDLDLFINIRLSALYNFLNLLTEENKTIVLENQYKNNKYSNEIESQKISILETRKKIFEENFQKKNARDKISLDIKDDSILNFSLPEFELYFIVKLIVNGHPIEPECITDLVLNKNFNEQIIIRYKFKDLTLDSYLSISVYSMEFPTDNNQIGYTRINLFNENYNLIQGKHIFKVYSKSDQEKKGNPPKFTGRIQDENLKEVDYLVNSFESANINNNYNFLNLENIKNSEYTYNLENNSNMNSKDAYDFAVNFNEKLKILLANTENSYIEISFQKFPFPVIYEEEKNPVYKKFFKSITIKDGNNANKPLIIKDLIHDPEIRKGKNFTSKDNPITEKFMTLSRVTDDSVAKDIRPTPTDENRIKELLNTPDFIKLEDSDLILFWKYRYYLLEKQMGITKILNAVKWGDNKSESEFVQNILNKFTNIEICDILYMLSYKFCVNSFYTKTIHIKMVEVRNYAVKNLEKLNSNELNFILLQLVQALRYEEENDSQLKMFLLKRCTVELELATSLYWFLSVEADDSDLKPGKSNENRTMIDFYKNIFIQFEQSLDKEMKEEIGSQKKLREKLIKMAGELEKSAKEEGKKTRLGEITKYSTVFEMNKFPPLALPIYPNIKVNGTISDKCFVFKSAKYPVKYSFTVTNESQAHIKSGDPSIFDIMFKYGDDLRQDQLVLQIISYMDKLLKNVHLDFNFTTYKVLATSKTDGFVEFVPNCQTIKEILRTNNDNIIPFLKKVTSPQDDFEKTSSNYISSCAGYCVVTYILGIGDRHLENLLINNHGKLFHIDFGYILGEDPKPFPPPMKLCKQMVEAMEGKNSKKYEEFKRKCVDAYLCLRSNARILVNMFYLMIHSGIKQLSENHENELKKLHEKFVPNLNAQEASNSLLNKLEESVDAFFPVLMERIHNWASYFK